MDYEFHYYVNYLVAKIGGFNQEDSLRIAYSSQYVDDNTTNYNVLCKHTGKLFPGIITQTYDLSLPTEELYKIYSNLHFITSGSQGSQRIDGKTNSKITTPNNSQANNLLDTALKSNNVYAIGIASHAYADTWAHQNFTATFDDFNSGHSLIANIMPNIGHADFLEQPDLIGISWLDTRLKESNICNNKRFIECALELLKKYARHNNILPQTQYLKNILTDIFGESESFSILSYYKKRARRMRAYREITPEIPSYDPMQWLYSSVKIEMDGYYWHEQNYEESDWFKFQVAAKKIKKS